MTSEAVELAVCKWSWCPRSFQSQDELVEHVLTEHVENLAPVKRKNLTLLRRFDEGNSADSSGLGSLPIHLIPSQTQTTATESSITQQSTPSKKGKGSDVFSGPSIAQPIDGKNLGKRKVDDMRSPSHIIPSPKSALKLRESAGLNRSSASTSIKAQKTGFKRIADMSSPSRTPDASPLPPSPSTDVLVADLIRTAKDVRKQAARSSSMYHLPSSPVLATPLTNIRARQITNQKTGNSSAKGQSSPRTSAAPGVLARFPPTIDLTRGTSRPNQSFTAEAEAPSPTPRRPMRSGPLYDSPSLPPIAFLPEIHSASPTQSKTQSSVDTSASQSTETEIDMLEMSQTQESSNPKSSISQPSPGQGGSDLYTTKPHATVLSSSNASSDLSSQLELLPIRVEAQGLTHLDSQWPGLQTQAPYHFETQSQPYWDTIPSQSQPQHTHSSLQSQESELSSQEI